MRLRTVRGMIQGRQLAALGLLCGVCVFVMFAHLKNEIARLDAARSKLENTISRLEEDGVEHTHRRAPAAFIQQEVSYTPDVEDTVIIYNRVPKTGSTSFAGIAYELCTRNKFHVIHLNITKNNHVLSVPDQMRFVNNVTTWQNKKPAMYHGHVAYIEFHKFGVTQQPIYINIIREPLDRLVSYYYFVRHGDDFRPHIKRRKSGNKQTFDECVMSDEPDCDPEVLWMQIPFFCGHSSECWIPGNRWALERAKYNLVHNYMVVGVTEDLGDFIAVLEAALPRFFAGATQLYSSGRRSHLRKTFNKIPPSKETMTKIRQSEIWKMEQEFYEFAKEQFNFVKKRTFQYRDGYMQERRQQFGYEKIRPR